MRPELVVTDIEGTTTPISFVHDVLFPYARTRLPALVAGGGPDVAAELAAVPGDDKLATLLGWMANDVKATPLKALQGMLWRDGYADGTLKGALYPDVAPCLRAWSAAGVRLAVYSSGSEEAQRQLFGHSDAGELAGLFDGFFDTRIGAKRDPASYAAIAKASGIEPGAGLFLSDVEAELDAARGAGFATCQLVRPADGTAPSATHSVASEFTEVAARFGLL